MLGPRTRAALLAAAIVVGTAAVPAGAGTDGRHRPTVVVAVADAGVNPYHRAFFRPQNTAHPCTWVKGFTDCTVPALNLSVGGHDYEDALAKDQAAWRKVRPGRWYWIPRTNIIGAICDPGPNPDDPTYGTCILEDPAQLAPTGGRSLLWAPADRDGRGTGAASAVVSEAPDALLLIHEGDATAARMKSAPVTPDIQAHSWAPAAPVPGEASGLTGEGGCPEAYRRPQTLQFLAAGNNAPWPAIADCARQDVDVQVVGGAFPGTWNYDNASMYDFASWFCRPVARPDKASGEQSSCDTTVAAPTAAGAAADALHRIRTQERFTGRSTAARVSTSVTRSQFVAALQTAATYTPKAKYRVPDTTCDYVMCFVGWAPLPEQAPWLFWGYGWLDSTVSPSVAACALRRGCPAKSAEAVQYNQTRQTLRAAGSQ